jgi:hypothetical protein
MPSGGRQLAIALQKNCPPTLPLSVLLHILAHSVLLDLSAALFLSYGHLCKSYSVYHLPSAVCDIGRSSLHLTLYYFGILILAALSPSLSTRASCSSVYAARVTLNKLETRSTDFRTSQS